VRIEWAEGALDDLAGIFARLAEFSGTSSAERRIRKIQTSVRLLGETPEIGRRSKLEGVRELVIPNYPHIVGYRMHPDFLEIIGIRDGHEDFPAGGSWNQ
jgi:plasmid stabilization system protein ParE